MNKYEVEFHDTKSGTTLRKELEWVEDLNSDGAMDNFEFWWTNGNGSGDSNRAQIAGWEFNHEDPRSIEIKVFYKGEYVFGDEDWDPACHICGGFDC